MSLDNAVVVVDIAMNIVIVAVDKAGVVAL